jgi:hypothetical protein
LKAFFGTNCQKQDAPGKYCRGRDSLSVSRNAFATGAKRRINMDWQEWRKSALSACDHLSFIHVTLWLLNSERKFPRPRCRLFPRPRALSRCRPHPPPGALSRGLIPKSFVGGIVVAMISASWSVRQLSFDRISTPDESRNSRVGSASCPAIGMDGLIARTITLFGCVPVTMKRLHSLGRCHCCKWRDRVRPELNCGSVCSR